MTTIDTAAVLLCNEAYKADDGKASCMFNEYVLTAGPGDTPTSVVLQWETQRREKAEREEAQREKDKQDLEWLASEKGQAIKRISRQADHLYGNAASLPTDSKERLEYPLCTGLLEYFPRACAEVARHSKIGNDQHNPGEPMHWAKEKSVGRGDQIVRHLMDGKTAKDREEALHHFAGMCWRSLELFERFLQGIEPFDKGTYK